MLKVTVFKNTAGERPFFGILVQKVKIDRYFCALVLHVLHLVLHVLRLVLHVLRLVLHILRLVLHVLCSSRSHRTSLPTSYLLTAKERSDWL